MGVWGKKMAEKVNVEEQKYRYNVFRFLNYSANSVFYGVATIAAYLFTLVGIKILNDKNIVDSDTSQTTLILILAGIIIGLLWWLHSRNKYEYKDILSALLNEEVGLQIGEDKFFTKQNKLLTTVSGFKKLNIEKLRNIRLYALIVNILFGSTMLYIMMNYTDEYIFSIPTASAYIIGGVIFGLGVLFSFVSTGSINKSFDRTVSQMQYDFIMND